MTLRSPQAARREPIMRALFVLSCLTAAATAFAPANLSFVATPKGAASVRPVSVLSASKSPWDNNNNDHSNDDDNSNNANSLQTQLASLFMGIVLTASAFTGTPAAVFAADAAQVAQKYDGFAEYAQENKMEKSDVACFAQQCGAETKALFSNPRGIKGVSCLGRCKGEQSCAMRCFAEFSSDSLNDWLSCTIEENECVKVPKNVIDNSAENVGYTTAVKNFDPASLTGTWYKTDGLDPNYDLFDCQTNTFQPTASNELDMGIFFRVKRPDESGGGFWENALTEHMVVDAKGKSSSGLVAAANAKEDGGGALDAAGRTMHTAGKMNGLNFEENWYIIGESDGKGDVPEFKLVAYKGHTLQGNYEGSFVYAKEAILPAKAVPAVTAAASKAGLDFGKYTRIDNTCPTGNALNDVDAGTGTSTTDWIDLVVGEGGVIDWISPGWRGEYNK